MAKRNPLKRLAAWGKKVFVTPFNKTANYLDSGKPFWSLKNPIWGLLGNISIGAIVTGLIVGLAPPLAAVLLAVPAGVATYTLGATILDKAGVEPFYAPSRAEQAEELVDEAINGLSQAGKKVSNFFSQDQSPSLSHRRSLSEEEVVTPKQEQRTRERQERRLANEQRRQDVRNKYGLEGADTQSQKSATTPKPQEPKKRGWFRFGRK